ncbi:MAG: MGMT family protein [Candidatus Brockarchaeota archaeon]|nr:MGMT family protein [Candidatus Brockarchaeota archaeon]
MLVKKKVIDRRLVYELLKQVPKGRVTTYGALARAVGHSGSARAIGALMRSNPYAPTVPCHRVVYSDGRLGGYGGMKGMGKKARMLAKEGVKVKKGRIVDFEKHYFEISPQSPSP